jgi:hypothetical protein
LEQRLICGRISSNGKNLRKPAVFLAGKIFIKKAPASSRRGPTRKETYTPPPEELCSKSCGKRKHCFPSLPANCRQAGLLNWASGLNQQAAFNLFVFSPTSIKVYYTNRQGPNIDGCFLREADKTVWMRGMSGRCNIEMEGFIIPKLRLCL